jgi:hypothetical protein
MKEPHPVVPNASFAHTASLPRRIVAGAHWKKIELAERLRRARAKATFANLDRPVRDLGTRAPDDLFEVQPAHCHGCVPLHAACPATDGDPR